MARTALQVMADHGEKMASQDPDIILQDYAPDAVVLTNLADKPLIGHAAIRAFILSLRENGVLQQLDDAPTEDVYHDGLEGKGVQVFHKVGTNILGCETYVVENDLIVFETAYITLDESNRR